MDDLSAQMLIAILPTVIGFILIHESGHTLAARLAGYHVTAFGMGTGRIYVRIRMFDTVFYLGLNQPLQGLTFCLHPRLQPARWQQIVMLAGGILMNLLVALLCGLLAWWHESWSNGWLLVAVINGVGGLLNVIPMQTRIGDGVIQSDGAQILQVLRQRPTVDAEPQFWHLLGAYRTLFHAIQSTAHLRYVLRYMAWIAAQRGYRTLADSLSVEADDCELAADPRIQATDRLFRAAYHAHGGQREASQRDLQVIERMVHADADPLRNFWVRFIHGLILAETDPRAAIASWWGLVSDPCAVEHPANRLMILASIARALHRNPDLATGIDELLIVQQTLAKFPDDAVNSDHFRDFARWAVRVGELAQAERWYRACLVQAQAYDRLVPADVRLEFRSLFRPVYDEMAHDVSSLSSFDALFPDDVERQRQTMEQVNHLHQRRVHRAKRLLWIEALLVLMSAILLCRRILMIPSEVDIDTITERVPRIPMEFLIVVPTLVGLMGLMGVSLMLIGAWCIGSRWVRRWPDQVISVLSFAWTVAFLAMVGGICFG